MALSSAALPSASSMASRASSTATTPSASALPGGIFQGESPVSTAVLMTDPFVLFVIQASFIIILSRVLALFLGKMRQPRVIAEVLGGIILGPTVLGHIPNYSTNIFPTASLPFLNLVATIGLVLFLFIVGLEVDPSIVLREWRTTMAVGSASLVVPFGIGAAASVPIYNNFVNTTTVSYGYFILFVGTAFCITAFPVLARILTELRLLNTSVGVIVLSAGVINDVIGWVLLALTVALVNATTGLAALYVILVAIGWIAFLIWIVRPLFVRLARRTGSLNGNGPTQMMMTVTLLLVLVSAFFTDVIGIHPIFGGFLVGVIMPHEGNYALTVAEKLEDLVTVIFLPLYFALSGLKTNLSLLNTGKIWGYIILIITLALASKILPCTLAARWNGFKLRESFTIGTLMSCKGLVELIVLNIGLQANILNATLFSMFVVMALVTTFITTPATMFLYPPSYQRRRQEERLERRLENETSRASDIEDKVDLAAGRPRGALVILHRMEALPPIMRLLKTFQAAKDGQSSSSRDKEDTSDSVDLSRSMSLATLRLVELTERTSAVMRGASMLTYPTAAAQSSTSAPTSSVQARSQAMTLAIQYDLMLNVLMAYCQLDGISLDPFLSVAPTEHFADEALLCANREGSSLIILPWIMQHTSHTDSLLGQMASDNLVEDTIGREVIRNLQERGDMTIGIFVQQRNAEKSTVTEITDIKQETSVQSMAAQEQLIFPFVGGQDDRAALRLLISLVSAHGCRAVIIRLVAQGLGRNSQASPEETLDGHKSDETSSGSVYALGAGKNSNGFFRTLFSSKKDTSRSVSGTVVAMDRDEETLWNQCEALKDVQVKQCFDSAQFVHSFMSELPARTGGKSLVMLGRQPDMSPQVETAIVEGLSSALAKKERASSQVEEMSLESRQSLGIWGSHLLCSINTELLIIQAPVGKSNHLARQTSHGLRKSWMRPHIKGTEYLSDIEADTKHDAGHSPSDQGQALSTGVMYRSGREGDGSNDLSVLSKTRTSMS